MGGIVTSYLTLAAILFCIGLYGALTKKECDHRADFDRIDAQRRQSEPGRFLQMGINPSIHGQIFSLFTMSSRQLKSLLASRS